MLSNPKAQPIPRFASRRVRASGVSVELIERRPVQVIRMTFFIIEFDARGILKVDSLMQQSASAFEAAFAPHERAQGNVLEAQSRFLASGGRWKPSDVLRRLLQDAALGRIRTPRL